MRAQAVLLSLFAAGLAGCIQSGTVCNSPHTTCSANDSSSQAICVDLQSDPAHCGACSTACGAGEACIGGVCQCPPNTKSCGGACVVTNSDSKNCGDCNISCGALEQGAAPLCQEGKCVDSCKAGHTACGQSCVDLMTDAAHCNACNHACPQGQGCVAGKCQATVVATCFNTGELVGMDDNLVPQASVVIGGGPQSLAAHAGKLLIADTSDEALYEVDPLPTPPTKAAGGDKLGKAANQVLVSGTKAFVINSTDNNVQVLDLTRAMPGSLDNSRTVAQVPSSLTSSAANTNPYFGTFIGDKLYVTLLGTFTPDGAAAGNRILELDVSGASPTFTRELVLDATTFEKDAGITETFARPAGIAALGTKLYVALGNLHGWSSGGPGYLAVTDTAANPMSARYLKLPAACRNTGSVLATPSRIYVTCLGSYGWSTPGEALVVLDTATEQVVTTTTFPRCGANDPATCKTATPGRLLLRNSSLVIADSNAGRLFVTDLDGKVPSGKENGVNVCGLNSADSQMTTDVISLR